MGAALVLGAYVAMPGPQQALAQRQTQPGFDVPVCEGEISTFALGKVASGKQYWVDIFDKTDEALKFREIFLATLRDSGRGTGSEGQLVFTFESQSNFMGLVPRSSSSRFTRDSGGGRDSGAEVGISELRNTIRGDETGRGTRSTGGQEIDAKVELRDRATGRVAWLATVSCRPLTSDRTLLMEFVSKVIVDSLAREGGKSTF
ncbi:MAG: hypothetical protein O3B37_01475 [Proteobacteria bacterium]|nr:hypothetical protein [Pseudomonadota bacterium]